MMTRTQACERSRKAAETVYRNGFTAGLAGQPTSTCPYKDHRTIRGGVTFARFWRNEWMRGWQAGWMARPWGA